MGKALAEHLRLSFFDADDFHSPDNIEKMKSGVALTDEDRVGWLERLRTLTVREKRGVLACSALKARYRAVLGESGGVNFVYLRGTQELIMSRLKKREGHFMNLDLLASQFAALEEPHGGIVIDVDQSVGECVQSIVRKIGGQSAQSEPDVL